MKLVKEHLTEGVGDTYLETRFGIRDTTKVGNDIKDNKGEDIGLIISNDGSDHNTHVYKNPKSLENFDEYVRGILCKNGDLFLLEKMTYIKHEDLTAYLQLKGYIKAVKYNGNNIQELTNKIIRWTNIVKGRLDFIEVERQERTDTFGLGLWNHENVPKILVTANKKHPYFNFTNKH